MILYYKVIDENAVPPKKNHDSDAGYDISAIKLVKDCGEYQVYGTGLIVYLDEEDFYLEMFPRSSTCKTGYTLANSVGIIDRDYRGELLIVLHKFDKTKPDLELPSRIVQLIPKRMYNMKVEEVAEVSNTVRGEKGFGSSGSK